MAEGEKEKGFVIKDKRTFDESGEARADDITREAASEAPKQEKISQEEMAAAEEDFFPEVTFSNFVLSLSTTVMYHLGDFEDPVTKKAEKNLPAAKQTIDMLGMLKTKTAGNLDADEKMLLEGILYELMMRYVKEKGQG
ncbi:MAG TPA: DUF1844 domain-containing protein [Syntrophales bacterium]|nr:DUF1844 domain-containing protein [Syntrophales bacterium]